MKVVSWPALDSSRLLNPFSHASHPLHRCIFTILAVAAISGALGRIDAARGQRDPGDWVRTAQGWESRAILATPAPSQPPRLHPFAVAAFQLSASLLVLVGLPTRVTHVKASSPGQTPRPRTGEPRAKRNRRVVASS